MQRTLFFFALAICVASALVQTGAPLRGACIALCVASREGAALFTHDTTTV